MPPRLRLMPFQVASIAPRALPPAFLLPFLQVQTRSASILSSLSDVPSSYNKRIRKGRGPSSGKGKTAGRGHKGQKQHGKVPVGFQGGQTTEEVVKGSKGEWGEGENPFTKELSPVNLDTIQSWIEQKRLDPTQPITLKELARTRAIHGVKADGVKLLSRGSETFNVSGVHIITTRASAAAIAAVEAAGGKVTTRYYTPASVKRIKSGQTHPYLSLAWKGEDHLKGSKLADGFKFRLPDPIGRKDLEYYRDPAHRGYLSYMVGEGESPSLFFQTPLQTQRRKEAAGKTKSKDLGMNRIW